MNYEITGLSEPKLDVNNRMLVRIFTPDTWSTTDTGVKVEQGVTIFCYQQDIFDTLKVGDTITVN